MAKKTGKIRKQSWLNYNRTAIRIMVLLGIWCPIKNAQGVAGFIPEPSICEYNETTGQESRQFTWTLQKDKAWLLKSEDKLETHIAWLDESLNTYKWSLDKPAAKTSITATIENNILSIEGTRKGKDYHKEHNLDGLPWYQALSLSLRKHLGEKIDNLEFWSIRPDNFDIHRMQVSKIEENLLETAGRGLPAYHVIIRPAGWKAPFWKGEYWFRKSDGHFIRYSGDSGPPGCPPTIIQQSRASVLPKTNKK